MSPQVIRRCAVIGDVHAEHERLATALAWATRADVDVITCTGDVVDGNGDASRCCELLLQHNVLCVSGNHDRWLFTGLLRDRPKATGLGSLSSEHLKFLKTLPAYRELDTPVGRMLLCHGIGASDLEKITDLDTDYSLKVNRALQEVLASERYRVMVNGHSHCRLVRVVDSLTIVNAGTLCHMEDPGVLRLDFDRNLLQWHRFDGSSVVLCDERPIF
jgi:predicted phosphodiesterase